MKENYAKLTNKEKYVILEKGTEAPFSGKYNDFFEEGLYVCKRCRSPLYKSEFKFKSSCGWPSFDDEIVGAVKRIPDIDGIRTEIVCANCGAHLGHIFRGEYLTSKNLRHCVNSTSLEFMPVKNQDNYAKAYFAGGCFWGVEYLFEHKTGVISAVSGYMGGNIDEPSYEQVCSLDTGHIETVEVNYNSSVISYEELAIFFFEIHDPTQKNRQGPDVGEQYKSVIFYNSKNEKKTAENLIRILKDRGYSISTELRKAEKFWIAEEYHQNYYDKNKKKPYCHIYTKRF